MRREALGHCPGPWHTGGLGSPGEDDWALATEVAEAMVAGGSVPEGDLVGIGFWGARRHGVRGTGQGDFDLAVLVAEPARPVSNPAAALDTLVDRAQARARVRETLLGRVGPDLALRAGLLDCWVGFVEVVFPLACHTDGLEAYVLDDLLALGTAPGGIQPTAQPAAPSMRWTGSAVAWGRVAAAQRLVASRQALSHPPEGGAGGREVQDAAWWRGQLQRSAVLLAQSTQLLQGAPEGLARSWRRDWATQESRALPHVALTMVRSIGVLGNQVPLSRDLVWAWRDVLSDAWHLLGDELAHPLPDLPAAHWASLWRRWRMVAARPWIEGVMTAIATPQRLTLNEAKTVVAGAWALLSGVPDLPVLLDRHARDLDPWWGRHAALAPLQQATAADFAATAERLLAPLI